MEGNNWVIDLRGRDATAVIVEDLYRMGFSDVNRIISIVSLIVYKISFVQNYIFCICFQLATIFLRTAPRQRNVIQGICLAIIPPANTALSLVTHTLAGFGVQTGQMNIITNEPIVIVNNVDAVNVLENSIEKLQNTVNHINSHMDTMRTTFNTAPIQQSFLFVLNEIRFGFNGFSARMTAGADQATQRINPNALNSPFSNTINIIAPELYRLIFENQQQQQQPHNVNMANNPNAEEPNNLINMGGPNAIRPLNVNVPNDVPNHADAEQPNVHINVGRPNALIENRSVATLANFGTHFSEAVLRAVPPIQNRTNNVIRNLAALNQAGIIRRNQLRARGEFIGLMDSVMGNGINNRLYSNNFRTSVMGRVFEHIMRTRDEPDYHLPPPLLRVVINDQQIINRDWSQTIVVAHIAMLTHSATYFAHICVRAGIYRCVRCNVATGIFIPYFEFTDEMGTNGQWWLSFLYLTGHGRRCEHYEIQNQQRPIPIEENNALVPINRRDAPQEHRANQPNQPPIPIGENNPVVLINRLGSVPPLPRIRRVENRVGNGGRLIPPNRDVVPLRNARRRQQGLDLEVRRADVRYNIGESFNLERLLIVPNVQIRGAAINQIISFYLQNDEDLNTFENVLQHNRFQQLVRLHINAFTEEHHITAGVRTEIN